MSVSTNDVLLKLAYRIGGTAVPTDATQKAKQLDWINDGYLELARRKNWWWLQATSTSNTNTGSTTGYSEPTDCKEFIELKVGSSFYDQIPYIQNRDLSTSIVTLPNQLIQTYQFYRFGGKYYFVVTDGADGATHNIKYYKRAVKLTDGQNFLIPDDYADLLAAYGEARYQLSIGQAGRASIAMQEYEGGIKQMIAEQNRLGSGWKQMNSIREPELTYY